MEKNSAIISEIFFCSTSSPFEKMPPAYIKLFSDFSPLCVEYLVCFTEYNTNVTMSVLSR